MIKPRKLHNVIVFCLTHLLSAFGYEFIFFIMTVYIYDITKSPLNVGIFTALTFFPKMFSPCYGVVVDRYNRQHVFGVSAGIAGIFILLMGFIRNMSWMYCLWFITAIFLMVIVNARTTLMTEVMPKDNFIWGNSATLISLNAAKLLAPLLGGIILMFSAKNILIYLTSVVYFVSMLLSLLITPTERKKIQLETMTDVVHHIKDGLHYTLENAQLKTLAVMVIFWRLFLGLQVSLFVVYVKSYLAKNDAYYGMFMTMIGLGSLLGSMAGPWLIKKNMEKDHTMLFTRVLFHYLSFIFLGVVTNYYIAVVTMFLSFGVFYFTLVGFHSLRDQLTPADFRGRVYGSITALTTPPAILSMLIGGFLAEVYGVAHILIGAGGLTVVSFSFVYWKFKNHKKFFLSVKEVV